MNIQGFVPLAFRYLSKIISRKCTMPEIIFMLRFSSWNFVRVSKEWFGAHVHSSNLKFSQEVQFRQYTNFERISWRARETLEKQPPGKSNSAAMPLKIKFSSEWSPEQSQLLKGVSDWTSQSLLKVVSGWTALISPTDRPTHRDEL